MTDPCTNRHRNNAHSRAAFRAGDKATDRSTVLATIEASGERGATCEEVAEILSRPPNQISGRFTELKTSGAIVKIGSRRTRSNCKAGVYRSNK